MESSSTEFYYWKIVSILALISLYSINFLIKKTAYDSYDHEIELLNTKIARTNNNDLLLVLKFMENAENTLPYFAIKKIEYNKKWSQKYNKQHNNESGNKKNRYPNYNKKSKT